RSSSAVPRNLEIKVRVADLAPARATAARLGARPAGVEVQVDRYYELEGGSRLKLRTVPGRPAELIRYRRPECDAVRTSDYEVTPVRDADARRCLVPKTRPVVTVRKRRAARSSCSTTSASTSTRWTGSAGSWSSKRSWMRRTTRRRVAGEWPRSRRRSASA